MSATAHRVPGVYQEPQPRAPEAPTVRTDVVGFIGFDPRVRDGTTASRLTGSPPTGHAFRIDVAGFQHAARFEGDLAPRPDDFTFVVPAVRDFVLSESETSIPVSNANSIVYALVVRAEIGGFDLAKVAGVQAPTGTERSPDDAAITAALGTGVRWRRLADVTVRREGSAIFVTARMVPDLAITRCDDFRDYVLAFGEPPDDGTLLGGAVRGFFSNGGRRCWIATLRRPDFEDKKELANVLADLVGVAGSSEVEATGLERLLLSSEVTIVDVPDLYAQRVDRRTRSFPLPPSEREACFVPCREIPPKGTATSSDRTPALTPIFESSPPFGGTLPPNEVFLTQSRLLRRCIQERWRVLLLLSVPRLPDPVSGAYLPPSAQDAVAWAKQFDGSVKQTLANAPSLGDTEEVSCAALYWPWLLCQERVDAPVLEMPPTAYAAGVIARRDLSRGPQISPANETLRGVVGTATPIDDDMHGALYEPDVDASGFPTLSVNVVRAFPGYGIQVWGARTLSTERFLRFISVRRTLTAIELRMKAALDLLVFEPNGPALWLQITQTAFGVLLPLFESGALRGERPEEAFFVRCDGRINPPEGLARGELVVEVGVAVAAPAEFIVFRVGRREGVIEVLE
jgi:uncharacterized protein